MLFKPVFCAPALLFFFLAAAVPANAQGSVEAGFSDHGGSHALGLVLKAVQRAEKSICMAAFSFTSKEISSALVKAHERGVNVMVVADREANTDRYTAVTYLANHKIPVRLNGEYDCMHNKFMVVDDKHVQTGSFNYTKAAARKNAENVVVIWNAPELATLYAKEWRKLWEQGKDYPSRH